MLFLVLQANYCEKIILMGIFSLVSPNAAGLFTLYSVFPTRTALNLPMLSYCIVPYDH